MNEFASKLAEGDFTERIDVKQKDEIGDLARARITSYNVCYTKLLRIFHLSCFSYFINYKLMQHLVKVLEEPVKNKP